MSEILVSDDSSGKHYKFWSIVFRLLGLPLHQTGILLIGSKSLDFYSPPTDTNIVSIIINELIMAINSSNKRPSVIKFFDIDVGFEPSDRAVGLLSDGRILVASGSEKKSKIIEQISKQVMAGPSMAIYRQSPSSAMFGGDMYLCGGRDEQSDILSSCEVYRDGQWMQVAHMNSRRKGHALVSLDGLLYAIGGYSNCAAPAVNTVECYCPDTNSWQPVSSLNQSRAQCSAAALNGYIYVAGGFADGRLESCERYDQKKNKWEAMADMCIGRAAFSFVSFGDKLYAIGGDIDRWSGAVDRYDPIGDKWEIQDILHVGMGDKYYTAVQWQNCLTRKIKIFAILTDLDS